MGSRIAFDELPAVLQMLYHELSRDYNVRPYRVMRGSDTPSDHLFIESLKPVIGHNGVVLDRLFKLATIRYRAGNTTLQIDLSTCWDRDQDIHMSDPDLVSKILAMLVDLDKYRPDGGVLGRKPTPDEIEESQWRTNKKD